MSGDDQNKLREAAYFHTCGAGVVYFDNPIIKDFVAQAVEAERARIRERLEHHRLIGAPMWYARCSCGWTQTEWKVADAAEVRGVLKSWLDHALGAEESK